MRILLIAPDQAGINSIPEVRAISGLGRVLVLNGPVSSQDVYTTVRYNKFDIVHFATHGDESVQMLSSDDTMSPEDVAQVARLCGAQLVFFNSCRSGLFAAYLTRHGVRFAVHTNIELKDKDAWKMPSAFYDILNGAESAGKPLDYIEAYKTADSGDGIYGLSLSFDVDSMIEPLLRQLQRNTSDIETLSHHVNQLIRRQSISMVMILLLLLELASRWLHYYL